jgi:proteic killer suppression protein
LNSFNADAAQVFSLSRDVEQTIDARKHIVYNLFMIRSFADKETVRFYTTGKSRRLPAEIHKRANMRLTQLNAATTLEDLRMPPSNRLEALQYDRLGQWSIRINDQWRVCFRFEKGDAFDVEIVDYH